MTLRSLNNEHTYSITLDSDPIINNNVDLSEVVIKKETWNFVYVNARSVKNKIEEIVALTKISDVKVDFVIIVETWIKVNEERYVSFDGYEIYNAGRSERSGGGSAILVSKDLRSQLVSS